MILEAAISGFGETPPGDGQGFSFGRCVHGGFILSDCTVAAVLDMLVFF